MESSVSVGSSRQKTMKQLARMKQTMLKPVAIVVKAPRKSRTVTPKDLYVSLTVGIACEDVSGETFDLLAAFIQQHAKMGIISFERGDAHLLLHIQGMISIKSSSVRMLKQEIRKAVWWLEDGPLGGSICIKSLRDKGLHTIVGIIGYCLKDEKEEHFRMFQKNVTDRQMDEGRRMYGIYGASEFKNRLQTITINDIDEIFFGYRRKLWYWNFTHPTEHMIADARTGYKPSNDDSDDTPMPELEGDDGDSDDPNDQRRYNRSLYDTLHGTTSPQLREFTADPNVNMENVHDSPSKRPRYRRIAALTLNVMDPIAEAVPAGDNDNVAAGVNENAIDNDDRRAEILAAENDDNCEEIVDIDAYAREAVREFQLPRRIRPQR
ncbi:hypothetical protein R1sor_010260 [Riccia sorocarpa]|uniref:Replitron HUH endonuclease domain-containing protein n=1 Tax=Riccia sorocarpa TaxID=122646 RepID=A0ABD3I3K9_9MARC